MVWKSALFINHSAQSVSRGELNEHFRNIYKNVRPVAEIIFSIYLVVCTDRTFTGYMHVCVLLLQQCPSLCNPMDYNPPGSFIHGILQAGILEWVAGPSSRGSPRPGDRPISLMFPVLAGMSFTTSATWEDCLTRYILSISYFISKSV